MGLLGGLFGRSRRKEEARMDEYASLAEGLYTDVKAVVEEERARYEELRKKQEEEAISYQQRQSNFGGAGRKGLIYGG